MKILFHFTITLFVLSLVACNQTKSPEPVKQYTFIGGKEGERKEIRWTPLPLTLCS